MSTRLTRKCLVQAARVSTLYDRANEKRAALERVAAMLETLPNRYPDIPARVRIQTPYAGACPVSGEPHEGSWIAVEYSPAAVILGFDAVARHLPTYATEATDVEAVCQMLARDCTDALGVPVKVEAHYKLRDGIELHVNA